MDSFDEIRLRRDTPWGQASTVSASGVAGPSLATIMWSTIAASAPFVAGAVLKISYDIALFYMFRKVKPPEEVERTTEEGTILEKEG